ncbi:hypothetical protein ACFE04_023340 [Oxalis oulophora]
MDDLPASIIIDEILSRLTDSFDLAHCRLVSKTFNDFSYEVKSIKLLCTLSRYLKSRSLETVNEITPFKSILMNLVSKYGSLESVSIVVDESIGENNELDESDDLYMCDGEFFKEWGFRVSPKLKRLSISDFWNQACWRRSYILALISSCCESPRSLSHNLIELELRNAALSVVGLNHMHTLTSLKLYGIILDDENLDKINECFPCLQFLKLCAVPGLKVPKIHLSHLKTCEWFLIESPLSMTIVAPNLVKLKLVCEKPNSLVLDTPLLSYFDLLINKELRDPGLSLDLWFLKAEFRPDNKSTKKELKVESEKLLKPFEMTRLETIFEMFPYVTYLTLGALTWFQMAGLERRNGMKELRKLVICLPNKNISVKHSEPFILSILDKCTNVSDISLGTCQRFQSGLASRLFSTCATEHPIKFSFAK